MSVEIKTLGELSINNKGSYGIAASAVPYSPDLYTYLRITDITDSGTLNVDGLMSVADENASEYLLQPYDIVFARTGASTGRNYFYDGTDGEFVYAGFLIKFSIDANKVNPYYVKYFCQSNSYKQWVQSFNTGSTRGNLNAKTYADMPIPVPSRQQQDFLVSVLQPIDDKIALNQQINKNLEKQAQAIFASYFITDNLFETMKKLPLSDLCTTITKGTTPTTIGKPFVDSGINFIKAESILDNHSIDTAKFAFIDDDTNQQLKRSIIHNKDILFTIAGTLGRFAFVDNAVLPANTNQAVAIIRTNAEKITPEYLYSFFIGNWHNDYYTKRIQQAVQANLSLTTIKSLPIPILPTDSMKKYLSVIIPIIAMIKHNENENRRLMSMRDTLLPCLISGEIDVSRIETDSFDYTEWRRNLFDNMTDDEYLKEAGEYAKTHPCKGRAKII